MNSLRPKILYVLSLTISLGILAYLLSTQINYSQLKCQIQHFTGKTWALLAVSAIFGLVYRFFVARQLKYQLGPSISTFSVYKIHLISTFYSLAIPSELLGGGVSWYLFSKKVDSKSRIAYSMAITKLVYYISLIPVASIAFVLEPRLKNYSVQWGILLVSIVISAAYIFFFTKMHFYFKEFIDKFVKPERRAGPIARLYIQFWNTIEEFNNESTFSKVHLWTYSLFIQLANVGSLYFILVSTNLNFPVSAAFWIIPFLALIHALPITFCGFGAREMGLIFFLKELYGFTPEASLLVSILIMLNTVLIGVFLGGFFSLIANIHISKSQKATL